MEPRDRQYQPGERVPGTEYVVVRLEAEGGHGALYLVRHHFLEKKIQMLKTLRAIDPSADLVERLKREAQMLAAMDHPHIVTVTSGGLTDEQQPRPYFVMERLKGRSLAQILPEAPEGVGIDAALKVTIEVCDALEYVHVRHGVVHRDIKPDNVFLHITPRNGSVTKLLDFGVAHIMDLEKRYTRNNLFLGTPRYASPEQIMGETPSPQTDLYAVGLLLYELLLGNGPFDDAQNFATVATAHCQREPPAFPTNRRFPEGLEELVMSLLRKKATDRPKSAEWLATRLRQIKRIAEVAEHADGADLAKTDLSPMQNVLTSHRAHLTEGIVPPELASAPGSPRVPPSAVETAPESPIGYVPTMMLVTPGGSAPAASPVDRSAPTRTLHETGAGEQPRTDTESIPVDAFAATRFPENDVRPVSSAAGVVAAPTGPVTSAAVEVTAPGAARGKRRPPALLAGVAAALALAVVAAGLYAKGATSNATATATATATPTATATSTATAIPTATPTPGALPSPAAPATGAPSASAPSASATVPRRAAPARGAPAAAARGPAQPLHVPSSGL
jgi:serine/threonine-protein kinase